ncbi:MAG: Uma2 family endonuclease [Chloroflexi bacterium]|nr:Uma2 family endonuclease [Chloroflexota bacterium]
MAITERRLTPEEFLKLPEEKPYLELIDGKVVQKPLGQEQHGALQMELGGRINSYARPRRLAWAFSELRGRFGADVLLPDVSIYSWERVPRDPGGRLTNVYQGPPDIAIEIVSPDQSARAMIRKCRRYLDHGTRIALVVDPGPESVVRLTPDGDVTTLRGSDRIDLDAVVLGFELTVQELFDTLRVD